MNEKDWIEEVSGNSWEDRATGPDTYDCWGLVVDFYRRVKGFEIENIAGYVNGETGVRIGSRVIHAFGGVKRDGQVFNHTLSQFNRIYRGNVKYFDYIERV